MITFFSSKENLILVLIFLLALSIRIPLLNGSFWLDEAAQVLESSRPLTEQLNIVADFQPPLLHYLIHFGLYINSEEWWLRAVGALLPAIVTILFTYKIGTLLWNKRTGLIAALLLASSSFHVFYSQELRQYSLPAGLATVSWFLLLKAWKTDKTNSKDLIAFTLLNTLGLYASYLYPFALFAQLVFVLYLMRKRIKLWLGTLIISGISFLPILPLFLKQLTAGSSLRTDLPGWDQVVSFSQLKVLPLVLAKFLFGVVNVELNILFISLTALLAACIVIFFKHTPSTLKSKQLHAVLIWLILPITTAFLISYLVPVLQPKRVLFCLPAFYLFLASFISTKFKKTTFLLISLVMVINLYGLLQYWTNPNLQRENWKFAIAEIEAKYPTQSAVLFSFPEPFAPWKLYASKSYPAFSSGVILTDSHPNLADEIKKINEYNHVLLFEYLTDLTDPNDQLKSILESFGYEQQGYFVYPNIGKVWIYSKPAAVISYSYQ